MSDDQELANELGDGEKAAWLLARHLLRMGAAKAGIPVEIDGDKFTVTINQLPVI